MTENDIPMVLVEEFRKMGHLSNHLEVCYSYDDDDNDDNDHLFCFDNEL